MPAERRPSREPRGSVGASAGGAPGARDRRGGFCPRRVAVVARHVDLRRRGLGDPRRLGLELQHARVAGLSRHEPRDRVVGLGAPAQRQEGPRPEVVGARVVRVERERLRGRAQRVGGAARGRAARGPCSRGTPRRAGGRPARPRPLASRVARPPPPRRAGRRRRRVS